MAAVTPTGALAEAIDNKFGSFDAFKEEFAKAAQLASVQDGLGSF